MRKAVLPIVGFLALAGVIGYVATWSGGLQSAQTAGEGGSIPSRAPEKAAGAVGNDEGVAGVTVPEATNGNAGGAAAGGELSSIGALPQIGPDIVKTAGISIEVRRGGFETAFNAASTIAGRFGGYVQDSSMRGIKAKSGRLTIRVPASAFEQVMNDLRGLGSVEGQSISGQDVTSQFIDLNARLRTWEAQEAVLLRLMRRATSIESTLRVQNQLQDVQFRIEQIKGQLRLLENQTSLATIDVSLREVGAVVGVRQTGERPSLGEAWDRAVDGFLGVIFAVVVGLGYLIPLAAIAFAIGFGYRRYRARPASAA
ncbi:MAG TPA: DUF4349 domain-containing protein [Actinomycetota bacterium]|nr:DUF4349 domain-containing protein [Actinomycetota bacterium]